MKRGAWIGGAGLLALGSLGALWIRDHTGPVPPRPTGFEDLDPLVRTRLEEEISAVSSRRRSAEAWRRLGMVEEANGLFGDAVRAYERSLALAPGDGKTLHRLAVAQERLGDLERAVETMARAAAAQPSWAASWWWLAWWRLDLGAVAEAEEALGRARELAPSAPAVRLGAVRLALARHEPQAARERLERDGLLAGDTAPYASHLLAQALRQLGDLDGAAAALAAADGRKPLFPDPWLLELQAFETGYAALRLRAGRDVQARRFPEAEQKLREVLQHDPEDARAWNTLGVCRLEQGDVAGALEHCRRALALDPTSREAAVNEARALLTGRSRDTQALAAASTRLERLLLEHPEDPGIWRAQAGLLESLGRTNDALAALEGAAALDPGATDVRLRAGYLELTARRFDAALDRFRDLRERHPELTEAHFGVATTLVHAGRAEEARAALETLAARPDADPQRLARLREQLDAPR